MNSPAAEVASVARSILALLVAAVPMLATVGTAHAQANVDLSTDHVTVDLSVIGDMGAPMASGGAATVAPPGTMSRSGGLLVPGTRNPTSQLHVAVPPGPGGEKITLRPPGGKPKTATAPHKPAPAAAKKPAPAKPAAKPEAKPEEKTAAASSPPAPLTAPPPAPAVAAAPAVTAAKDQPPAAAQPEKQPQPAAQAEPAKTEQASTPPAAAAPKEGRALQVAFAAEVSKLPDASKDSLAALAKQLKDNEALRLQLLAYAGGKDLSPSKARRLSLSRALSVRSFLIENGIRSTRIDVRALGDKTTEEPVNRVDVNIVER